jgi:hypothetical protein
MSQNNLIERTALGAAAGGGGRLLTSGRARHAAEVAPRDHAAWASAEDGDRAAELAGVRLQARPALVVGPDGRLYFGVGSATNSGGADNAAYEWLPKFLANKIAGPASKLPQAGFERSSHCQFGPDSALYVVDWGEIRSAPERGGVRMPLGAGTLWRTHRTGGPRGERPPESMKAPVYALQLAGIVGAAGLAGWAIWRPLRGRQQ